MPSDAYPPAVKMATPGFHVCREVTPRRYERRPQAPRVGTWIVYVYNGPGLGATRPPPSTHICPFQLTARVSPVARGMLAIVVIVSVDGL